MSTEVSPLTLETLSAVVAMQATELTQLKEANAALQDKVSTLGRTLAVSRTPVGRRTQPQQHAERTSRRKLLQLGGAAAAATVAAGVLATNHGTADAAPTHADTITLQESAINSGNIAIEGDGTMGAQGVKGTSDINAGVFGVSGSGFAVAGVASDGYGLYGQSTNSYGLYAQSTRSDGVHGVSLSTFSGVAGLSTNGVGGYFSGGRAVLNLQPAGVPGIPGMIQHFAGDLIVDSDSVLWYCIATGTPGTWVRLVGVANGTSGGALGFLATPIRLLDTRMGASGAADTPNTPIQPSAANTFHLPVAGVTFGGVTIPSTAQALVGNCTVVNPAGVGDLAVYPDLLPLPNTAVMHYLTGQIVSNGITIGLGTDGKLAITALGSATDVIIDCQGVIM